MKVNSEIPDKVASGFLFRTASLAPLQILRCDQHGNVAQLVRAGLLYSQGHGFKSRHSYPHQVWNMVVVAQLVEHWIVVPVVAGSIPVDHPTALWPSG